MENNELSRESVKGKVKRSLEGFSATESYVDASAFGGQAGDIIPCVVTSSTDTKAKIVIAEGPQTGTEKEVDRDMVVTFSATDILAAGKELF